MRINGFGGSMFSAVVRDAFRPAVLPLLLAASLAVPGSAAGQQAVRLSLSANSWVSAQSINAGGEFTVAAKVSGRVSADVNVPIAYGGNLDANCRLGAPTKISILAGKSKGTATVRVSCSRSASDANATRAGLEVHLDLAHADFPTSLTNCNGCSGYSVRVAVHRSPAGSVELVIPASNHSSGSAFRDRPEVRQRVRVDRPAPQRRADRGAHRQRDRRHRLRRFSINRAVQCTNTTRPQLTPTDNRSPPGCDFWGPSTVNVTADLNLVSVSVFDDPRDAPLSFDVRLGSLTGSVTAWSRRPVTLTLDGRSGGTVLRDMLAAAQTGKTCDGSPWTTYPQRAGGGSVFGGSTATDFRDADNRTETVANTLDRLLLRPTGGGTSADPATYSRNASFYLNGNRISSDTCFHLDVGQNTFTVLVVAEDYRRRESYDFTVTRQGASASPGGESASVTLDASPNPVNEGSDVTVTVTLSETAAPAGA